MDWRISIDGRIAGYGAVSNRYDKDRLIEFYAMPHWQHESRRLFQELLTIGGATHVAAQTNFRVMPQLLFEFSRNLVAENYLFEDSLVTSLPCPGGEFRKRRDDDLPRPEDAEQPGGDWIVDSEGRIVASGGFLCHYNPPYGDIYMNVAADRRRQGYGSYIVQELKRVCYEAGKRPAARCNADNLISRRTLEKGGLAVCGRMLVGEVTPPME